MLCLDPTARAIVNGLQGEFPLTSRPFRDAGRELGLTEDELIEGVRDLTDAGALSRFGPLWNAEQIGGGVCLAAMAVPPGRFEEVAEQVNAHPEIAHNYERAHLLNMWFVISADDPRKIQQVIAEIEHETGLAVHAMPKTREFFVGFRIEV
jgi:DNA-binding Lrp family transcriptional regulator